MFREILNVGCGRVAKACTVEYRRDKGEPPRIRVIPRDVRVNPREYGARGRTVPEGGRQRRKLSGGGYGCDASWAGYVVAGGVGMGRGAGGRRAA